MKLDDLICFGMEGTMMTRDYWGYEPPLVISKPHCIIELEKRGLIRQCDVYNVMVSDLVKEGIEIDSPVVIRAEAQLNSLLHLASTNLHKPFIIINSVKLGNDSEDASELIVDHVVVGYDHIYAVISKNFREEALRMENIDYHLEDWPVTPVELEDSSVDEFFAKAEIVRQKLQRRLIECVGSLPTPVQAVVAFCHYYSDSSKYTREDYPYVIMLPARNLSSFVGKGGLLFRPWKLYTPRYRERPTVDQQGVVKCLTGETLPDGWVENPFPKRLHSEADVRIDEPETHLERDALDS